MDEPSTDTLQTSRHHVNNSAALLIIRLVIGLFLVETAYAALLFLASSEPLENFQAIAINLLWVAQSLKFIVEIIVVLAIVVPWASTNYYITDREIVRYVGLRRRDETIFDLDTLKSIELHQGWFGRMFIFGDISLTFSSSGFTEKTTLFGIYNPKKYERYLKNKLGSTLEG